MSAHSRANSNLGFRRFYIAGMWLLLVAAFLVVSDAGQFWLDTCHAGEAAGCRDNSLDPCDQPVLVAASSCRIAAPCKLFVSIETRVAPLSPPTLLQLEEHAAHSPPPDPHSATARKPRAPPV